MKIERMSDYLNKLILGTAQLGMKYGINNPSFATKSDRMSILNVAMKLGIKTLDTAEGYGESQKLIGDFHRNKKSYRFFVQSKFVRRNHQSLQLKLEDCLDQLAVSELQCYLFHSYDDMTDTKTCEDLLKLKEAGKIKNIGVSIYTNVQFQGAVDNPMIDVIQIPFNLFDNWNKKAELIKNAKRNEKIIQARSVFLQGLFFMQPATLPSFLSPLCSHVQKIQSLSAKYNINLQALALKYVMSFEGIDSVLIGVDNVVQLQTNVDCLHTTIPSELFDKLNEIDISADLLDPRNWK